MTMKEKEPVMDGKDALGGRRAGEQVRREAARRMERRGRAGAWTGRPQLAEEIVAWASRLGAVTADALADREGISGASATARLSAAARSGLLRRSRPLAGRPALFAATSAGMKACGEQGLEPCRVSAANAEHLIACACVAARLERKLPCARIAGERELRRQERELGGALASATLMGAGRRVAHRPDLVIWGRGETEPPIAVEVELSVKSARRLEKICTAWARCRQVAGVIYVVSPVSEQAVLRAVCACSAERSIAILALDELLAQR